MAVTNPDYDPNWQERQDHLGERMKEIETERKDIFSSGQSNTPENIERLKELQDTGRETLSEFQGCITNYRYPTIQEAARALFEGTDPDIGSYETTTIHEVDFDAFQTMDEVYEAWSAANDASRQAEAEARNGLPVGLAGGRDIFSNTGHNTIQTMFQTFEETELYPHDTIRTGKYVSALVTVDQRESECHICFMQDPKRTDTGGAIEPNIEDVASAMYRRINPDAAQNQNSGFFDRSKQSWTKAEDPSGLAPDQVHFYIHHPPQDTWQESFTHVRMEYTNGRFSDPSWTPFSSIPESLKEARRAMNEIDITQASPAPLNLIEAGKADAHEPSS